MMCISNNQPNRRIYLSQPKHDPIFALLYLVLWSNHWTRTCVKAVKRIFNHLAGTHSFGIQLGAENPIVLSVHSLMLTWLVVKLIRGYVVMMANGPILWRTKTQKKWWWTTRPRLNLLQYAINQLSYN